MPPATQEFLSLRGVEIAGMPLPVEDDVATNPVDACGFGSDGIVPQPDLVAHLVEKASTRGV
nr:hypothetical protein [Albitalea terrae]